MLFYLCYSYWKDNGVIFLWIQRSLSLRDSCIRSRRDGANSNFAMEFLGDFQIFIGGIHWRMSWQTEYANILPNALTAALPSFRLPTLSVGTRSLTETRICNRHFHHTNSQKCRLWHFTENLTDSFPLKDSPLLTQLYKFEFCNIVKHVLFDK